MVVGVWCVGAGPVPRWGCVAYQATRCIVYGETLTNAPTWRLINAKAFRHNALLFPERGGA
jgi:hypothetical protein